VSKQDSPSSRPGNADAPLSPASASSLSSPPSSKSNASSPRSPISMTVSSKSKKSENYLQEVESPRRVRPNLTIDTSCSTDRKSQANSQKSPSDSTGGVSDHRDMGGRKSAFHYISPVSDTNDICQSSSRDPTTPNSGRAFAFDVDSPDGSLELNFSLSSPRESPMAQEHENQAIHVIECRDPEESLDQVYDAETTTNERAQDERSSQSDLCDQDDRQSPVTTYSQSNEHYAEEIEEATPLADDSGTIACQSTSGSNQNDIADENEGDEPDLPQFLSESTQHGLDAIDADMGPIQGSPERLTTAVESLRDSPRNKTTDLQMDDQSYSSWSIKPKVSSPYSVDVLIDHEDKGPRSKDVDGRKLPDDNVGYSDDDIDDVEEVNTNDLMTIMEEATSSIKDHELRYSRQVNSDHVVDESAEYQKLPPTRPSVFFHDGLRSESNRTKSTHEIVRRSRFTTPTFPPKKTKSTDTSSSGENAAESDFYQVEDFRESFDSLEFVEANAYRCAAPPMLYHWLDSACIWLEGIHCLFCFQTPMFRRPKKRGKRSKIGSANSSLSKKVSRPSSPRNGEGSVSSRRRLQQRSRSTDERSRRSRTSTRSLKERRSPGSRGDNHVQFAGNFTDHQHFDKKTDVEME
jgi:hypothetical protein